MPQQSNTGESQTRQTSENQSDRQSLTTSGRRERQNAISPYGFGLSPGDLLRMSPFMLMRRMGEEIDRVFSGGDSRSGGWMPAIEISQQGGNCQIHAELPGIDPKDVKVEIEENAIVLAGERESRSSDEREGVQHTERRYGSFYRRIPLPEGADPQQARARFENGMLEITLPVKEQAAQRRRIPVESGPAQSSSSTKPQGTNK